MRPADKRLQRFHPDALPSYRQCPLCPPGADVHELNRANFYERSDRYPWQDSRFSKLCRAHDNERRRTSYANNAQAQNAQTAQRRRVTAQNKVQAAYFYTAEYLARKAETTASASKRRVNVALYKRQMLRLYGPRDGVKKLIAERQQMYAAKRSRAGAGSPSSTPEPAMGAYGVPTTTVHSSGRMSPKEAMETLRRLRAMHHEQQHQREAQDGPSATSDDQADKETSR